MHQSHRRHLDPLLAALLLVALAAIGPSPTAEARAADKFRPPTSCSYSAADARVVVAAGSVEVKRRGVELRFTDRFSRRRVRCSGGTPTVRNTNEVRIKMIDKTLYESVILNLRGGRLGPGAAGAGRRGEIEFDLRYTNRNNGGEGAALTVLGGRSDETITMGKSGSGFGLNLNADRERRRGSADVDVTARVKPKPPTAGAPLLTVRGGPGADRLLADSPRGFDGLLRARDVDIDRLDGSAGRDTIHGGPTDDLLLGGSGADELRGGPGRDEIRGAGGRDRYAGGSGDDLIQSRDGRAEVIDCGAGDGDRSRIDEADADSIRRCETVSVG